VVNDVLELESDKIIARIRAEFADELEQTKEQLEEAREETAKTKEIIRLLRAGKGISEVADALQISKDKVNEIAELLK
jgi:DNA-binding NarL/FixJ family response regulator